MFTFPNKFEADARQAAATMTGNVADLPGCDGMMLVRAGTPEHEEREKDTAVLMMPIKIQGAPYCICSK